MPSLPPGSAQAFGVLSSSTVISQRNRRLDTRNSGSAKLRTADWTRAFG